MKNINKEKKEVYKIEIEKIILKKLKSKKLLQTKTEEKIQKDYKKRKPKNILY